ncbi:NAD(P)/FAD-dependent oxidoreductase [Pseudomonas sp. NY15181]|uniref:NAD(P)/FAD-dependent oxidoreductase n=1 Tax=Pseudomonas sp. NY15181 TaxID=3400349 RepID=UPI003A86CB33
MLSKAGLEVVVVGGGLVGLSAAYYLQRSGARVTVLEQRAIAANVPAISLKEAVWFSSKKAPLTDLSKRGATLLHSLLEDIGYASSVINQTIGEVDRASAPLDNTSQHHPIELRVMLWELADLVRERGGKIFELTDATNLTFSASRVTGVVTSIGHFVADEVVIAAGLGSQWLLNPAGLKLGLKIGTCKDFAKSDAVRSRRYVPLTSQKEPFISRPTTLQRTVIAVGHGNNPVAALAAGERAASLVGSPA